MPMELLVTPQWVAERLNDPALILLDATLPPVGVLPKVDTHGRYLEEHLPGALFFDIDELSDHASGLPHTLPRAESFAKSMSAIGVADTATIVVYEQESVFSAPRALWMLRTYGAGDVHLLQGGLKSWKAAGLPIASGAVSRSATAFQATFKPGAVTTFEALQGVIASRGQILDARSAGRFDGTAPEPRAGLSSGHMPGATSTPFTDLVTNGALKSPHELKAIFAANHVDLQQPITTSCGSGVTAAVVSLALELAGAEHLSLYDGSWAEYAQRPEAVIEKSTAS
jgi:thiosulfate/3-mercaptopyruvate sulfurtransferase